MFFSRSFSRQHSAFACRKARQVGGVRRRPIAMGNRPRSPGANAFQFDLSRGIFAHARYHGEAASCVGFFVPDRARFCRRFEATALLLRRGFANERTFARMRRSRALRCMACEFARLRGSTWSWIPVPLPPPKSRKERTTPLDYGDCRFMRREGSGSTGDAEFRDAPLFPPSAFLPR